MLTASATAAVLAGVGIATGAIPGPDGQIQACYDQHGNVRIAKQASDCKKNETAIAWNQRGPAGPPGATGPAGPPGPPGGSGGTVALSFGYPRFGDCGTDVPPDRNPSLHPCPFRVIDAPAGARVTLVRNHGDPSEEPYGYCVGGLASVPRSVVGQVGNEFEDAQGRFTGMRTALSDGTDPGVEIQRPPPSFCPSGSQFVVRLNQADTLGGAECSQPVNEVPCDIVVYRLILG